MGKMKQEEFHAKKAKEQSRKGYSFIFATYLPFFAPLREVLFTAFTIDHSPFTYYLSPHL